MKELEIKKKKSQAIYIELQGDDGGFLYSVMDKYRQELGATWKEMVIRAVALSMIKDEFNESEEVVKYFQGMK